MQSLLLMPEERPRGSLLWLSTLQWFVFALTNVITVPVVLGHAFGLSAAQNGLFIEQTFFICGVINLLQLLIGHRYPIIEGPAGMWWGVVVVLIGVTKESHGSLPGLLASLELGLLCAGIVFLLIASLRLTSRVLKLFTPIVTGTFLVLLALQLSKSLVSGMLGVDEGNHTQVVPLIACLTIALTSLSIGLMLRGKGILKNMAVLITLALGWLIFAVLGMVRKPLIGHTSFVAIPKLFPWGIPKFHVGIVLTCMLTAIILMSNLVASIQAFAGVIGEQADTRRFSAGTFISGIGTVLSGLFGTIGNVPLTSAASFVSLTRIASKLPFLLASVLLMILGLIPSVGQFAGTLPAPVGYAVLFTVFGQLLGFGLRDFHSLELNQRDVFVLGIPLLTGVGTFFLPNQAWSSLPPFMSYILDNGLIVGIVIVLLLEHVIFRKKRGIA